MDLFHMLRWGAVGGTAAAAAWHVVTTQTQHGGREGETCQRSNEQRVARAGRDD